MPLNKKHQETPKPDEMRPVIALSSVVKLLKSRFRNKLDDYMDKCMIPCQVEFMKECGTHVNTVRLINRCHIRYSLGGKNQWKFKTKAILFIEFMSPYNNVNLDECSIF